MKLGFKATLVSLLRKMGVAFTDKNTPAQLERKEG
jgi:hypothetical protein